MKFLPWLKKSLHLAIDRRLRSLWYPPSGRVATSSGYPQALLKNLSKLYEKALQKDQIRLCGNRIKLKAPVISIGNLSVGGTGKTPLAIWVCEFLQKEGFHPAVLTRGYGRKGKGPESIPGRGDTSILANHFGDEPVMMARRLPETPIWVDRNRAASGMAALERDKANVLLLDDGFQHLALDRDLDIVLLDCRNAFGNGSVLPAGPLREPISNLQRADAFVITHSVKATDSASLKYMLSSLFPGKPIFACRHKVVGVRLEEAGDILPPGAFSDEKAVVFAGIARPDGFFEDLGKTGISISKSLGFPDHYRYTPADLSHILGTASNMGVRLIITTAKDYVRLPSVFREVFAVAEMGMDFGEDTAGFQELISNAAR